MDLPGAAQYGARAVEVNPNNVPALQLLAAADVKLAKWQEAKSAFERILTSKPDDVDALFGLGQCELELKNYPAAVDKLQLVLKLAPTRLLAHYYLSRAYAGMGKTEDAQHEAALHQLMMEQMTFVRAVEREGSEAPIQAPGLQLLAERREADALQLYRERFKGTLRHFSRCVCVRWETVSQRWEKTRMGSAVFIMRWNLNPLFAELIPMREYWT